MRHMYTHSLHGLCYTQKRKGTFVLKLSYQAVRVIFGDLGEPICILPQNISDVIHVILHTLKRSQLTLKGIIIIKHRPVELHCQSR